jgi:hypothetical protein
VTARAEGGRDPKAGSDRHVAFRRSTTHQDCDSHAIVGMVQGTNINARDVMYPGAPNQRAGA